MRSRHAMLTPPPYSALTEELLHPMDRFARNYLIGLSAVIGLGLLYYLASSDPRVGELNDLLKADQELADYVYPFRVLELTNGVAVMSSPRSASVPVVQFLRAAYPELGQTAVTDPAMMAAQDRLAAVQSRAAELVRAEADVRGVRWRIDEQWFREHGVFLQESF